MRWHLDIPKVLHVYWGGQPLPYLRLLTIKTFIKFNPDWKVVLWQPKTSSDKLVTWESREFKQDKHCLDYTSFLSTLPIERRVVDFVQLGLDDSISDVHKSDYLRYKILHEEGGVWGDMDIFYIAGMNDLKVNNKKNKEIEVFVCISSEYGHSIGFLMAKPNNAFFKNVLDLAAVIKEEYQGIGASLLNKHYPNIESITESSVMDLGMEAVYSYNAKVIKVIYNSNSHRFSANSIGLHWYAGSAYAARFLYNSKGGTVNLPDNVLGNLIRRWHQWN